MKTSSMKTLLKDYWREFSILLLLIFVFSVVGITNCTEKHVVEANDMVNTGDLRAYLVDSVQTVTKLQEIAKLDSLKAEEAFKTQIATANAEYWKFVAEKRAISATLYKSKADSLANIYEQSGGTECIEIIGAFREANDSLKSENVALLNVNSELDKEAEGYCKQLNLCDQQSRLKDDIIISKNGIIIQKDITIQSQQKQLKKKDTWFRRQAVWIGGVVGSVITILAMK